jgi:hypothetical protein
MKMMKEHLVYCRERVAPGYESSAVEPVAVAGAIEHALFEDAPKARYLVVPNRGAAGWIT